MNPKPIEQAKTPDLAQSMPALRRAAQKARELARLTDTEAPSSNREHKIDRIKSRRASRDIGDFDIREAIEEGRD